MYTGVLFSEWTLNWKFFLFFPSRMRLREWNPWNPGPWTHRYITVRGLYYTKSQHMRVHPRRSYDRIVIFHSVRSHISFRLADNYSTSWHVVAYRFGEGFEISAVISPIKLSIGWIRGWGARFASTFVCSPLLRRYNRREHPPKANRQESMASLRLSVGLGWKKNWATLQTTIRNYFMSFRGPEKNNWKPFWRPLKARGPRQIPSPHLSPNDAVGENPFLY